MGNTMANDALHAAGIDIGAFAHSVSRRVYMWRKDILDRTLPIIAQIDDYSRQVFCSKNA